GGTPHPHPHRTLGRTWPTASTYRRIDHRLPPKDHLGTFRPDLTTFCVVAPRFGCGSRLLREAVGPALDAVELGGGQVGREERHGVAGPRAAARARRAARTARAAAAARSAAAARARRAAAAARTGGAAAPARAPRAGRRDHEPQAAEIEDAAARNRDGGKVA